MHRERFRLLSRTTTVAGTIAKSGPLRTGIQCGRNALLPAVFLANIALTSCTPAGQALSCPEPVWKSYTHLSPQEVARKISHLEKMLDSATTVNSPAGERNDSIASGNPTPLELHRQLFELYIHHANPDYDGKKIYTCLTYLYQHGGEDSLRYLDWGRAVRDRESLMKERDSLANEVNDVSQDERKKSGLISRLFRERKTCESRIDSLTAVITAQQKTIQKLQKLDVLMERRRNNLQ